MDRHFRKKKKKDKSELFCTLYTISNGLEIRYKNETVQVVKKSLKSSYKSGAYKRKIQLELKSKYQILHDKKKKKQNQKTR